MVRNLPLATGKVRRLLGPLADLADGRYIAGFRPNHCGDCPTPAAAIMFETHLSVTELTGSETFVHLDHHGDKWVGLVHGVHDLKLGSALPSTSTRRIFISLAKRANWLHQRPMRWQPEERNMAKITLDNLAHSYLPNPQGEDDFALKELNHDWGDGEAYALLGASGCGKSTLLNIISGLLHPSQGRILFDDKDVTQARTAERNIAQVFQFPVVYDTMTVRDNLAFPLRNRGAIAAYIAERVQQIAAMIGMEDELNHKARGLTADAKQKISLGRGMVREDVNALLFDEPLTVIDPHMKWELRTQLKSLHHEFGHTMIYVTHDQTEALTFADKVVVMYDGRVVQIGTPQELFERPEHTFVGYFIGSPGMNVLPAEVTGTQAVVGGTAADAGQSYGALSGNVELGIRPEFVPSQRQGGLPVKVRRVEDVGRHKIVRADLFGKEINIVAAEGQEISPDMNHVTFAPEQVNVYVDDWRERKGRPPDEQDSQSKGMVSGSAGLVAGRVFGGDPADDGGELFGAGHFRQQPVFLGGPRMVRGNAGI